MSAQYTFYGMMSMANSALVEGAANGVVGHEAASES